MTWVIRERKTGLYRDGDRRVEDNVWVENPLEAKLYDPNNLFPWMKLYIEAGSYELLPLMVARLDYLQNRREKEDHDGLGG